MSRSGKQIGGRSRSIRFGTRFLLAAVTLISVLLGIEVRRANKHQELLQLLDESGVTYHLRPREGVPAWLADKVGAKHGQIIEGLSIGAVLAPTSSRSIKGIELCVLSPSKAIQLLRHPMLRSLQRLELAGSSINDDTLVPVRDLKNLEALTFVWTSVSAKGAEEIRRSLPSCAVAYDLGNGREFVFPMLHPLVSKLGIEPSIFSKAKDGDPKAIRALLDCAKSRDPDDSRLSCVLEVLSTLDPEGIQVIEAASRDRDPSIRRFSLIVLESYESLDTLSLALGDSDESVRIQAVRSLGNLNSSESVSLLLRALGNEYESVRARAAFSLRGKANARAVQGLTTASRDPSSTVRYEAILSLGEIANVDGVYPALEKALDDESSVVRAAAVRAISKSRGPNLRLYLLKASKDPDGFVASHAKQALDDLDQE